MNDEDLRWPWGKVYYTISDDIDKQERITEAIEYWESRTDIQFKERTDENNYILFVRAGGCWADVGMKGGTQEIGISADGKKGNMIHEIGHALGLVHEHSKSNRDDYLIVLWDNIKPGKAHNFAKYYNLVEFEEMDFNSIMMYPSYAFQKNHTLLTMTKLDGSEFDAQREELTVRDAEIISWMYNEIHDPVIEDVLNARVENVGITSDGEYYYTCSMNSSTIKKISQDGTIGYGSYQMILDGPTGLAYNKSDGLLYVSNRDGDILRITDLENGQVETVYNNIMQSDWSSFALSEDGTKMFDFYKGTLNVYDFKSGDLAYSLYGLNYGEDPSYEDEYQDAYYGAASVAVDASYIYTWNCWDFPAKVFVYDHTGEFKRQMELEYGGNGLSLSVFDGYLFVAFDDTYDPGTWYKYNIRNPVD